MNTRIAARLAWSVWAAVVVSLALGMFLNYFVNAPSEFWNFLVLQVFLIEAPFGIVGALIISRHPENRIGQIFCAITFLLALTFLAVQYTQYALVTAPRSLPGAAALAWLASWVNSIAIGLLAYMILLFPDGRLPSPGWRLVAWLYAGWIALHALATALTPGPFDMIPAVNNPLSIAGIAGALAALVVSAASPVRLLFIASFAASVVLRFRRAAREERQQVKWFAYAITLIIAWWGVYLLLQWAGAFALLEQRISFLDFAIDVVWGVAFASVPVSVGIAILKYRLYDIDLLINRTLVYALLIG
ncbi:MAG TPA: hypothetical protein VH393_08305, partial [Ktedonobacterales bacterium]